MGHRPPTGAGALLVFFTYNEHRLILSIKWTQESGWLEREECWRHRPIAEGVEGRAKCSRFLVQQIWIGGILPLSSIQAMDKCLEGSQRLRGSEGAVTGAVHESLTQQFGVPFRTNNARIRLLVLVNHKPITGGVHCEYWNVQFSVEGDVPVQIL